MSLVTYRELKQEDAQALYDLWSDWEGIRYTNVEKPSTLDELRGRIEVLKEYYTYVMVQEGQVIGILGCPPVDAAQGVYGLFYQLRKDCWGRGHGTRAVTWLLRRMQEQYGSVVLLAESVQENEASVAILQRAGFQKVGEKRCEHRGQRVTILQFRGEFSISPPSLP